jgi:peptide/nickel transport system substrate-binding protein
VLASTFETTSTDAFAASPFWTQEFVGAGPFRLDRWEPGAFIEASAFDRHVLGPPKIPRVKIVFIGDPNTATANLLAGEIDFAADDSIRFEQGLTLQREWASNKGGSVLVKPSLWRSSYIQFRPALLATPDLTDLRVLKALALTVDKQGLNLALFDGQGIMADAPFIPKTVDYYEAIEPATTKYAYDPKQAESIMAQAGYTRGADGTWINPSGARLTLALTTTSSTQNEAELSILGSGWRQAGFDVSEAIFPVAQSQDRQARASFPGLFTYSTPLGEKTLAAQTSTLTPRPENRWSGFNRGAWSNPEFDRVAERFNTALDEPQRVQLIAQMIRIYSAELPAIPLYFNPIPVAHSSALTGPQNVAPEADIAWNVYQWEIH